MSASAAPPVPTEASEQSKAVHADRARGSHRANADRADPLRLDALRARVEADPGSGVFVPLAEGCRRAGRYQEAIDICRAGFRYHPAYVSARATLGLSLIEVGDLDEAEAVLLEIQRKVPDNLVAVRGLADVYRRRIGQGRNPADAESGSDSDRRVDPTAAADDSESPPVLIHPVVATGEWTGRVEGTSDLAIRMSAGRPEQPAEWVSVHATLTPQLIHPLTGVNNPEHAEPAFDLGCQEIGQQTISEVELTAYVAAVHDEGSSRAIDPPVSTAAPRAKSSVRRRARPAGSPPKRGKRKGARPTSGARRS